MVSACFTIQQRQPMVAEQGELVGSVAAVLRPYCHTILRTILLETRTTFPLS